MPHDLRYFNFSIWYLNVVFFYFHFCLYEHTAWEWLYLPRLQWRCWSTSCRSPRFPPHRSYRWTCRWLKLPLAVCHFPEWLQMTKTVQKKKKETIFTTSCKFAGQPVNQPSLFPCGNPTAFRFLNEIDFDYLALPKQLRVYHFIKN